MTTLRESFVLRFGEVETASVEAASDGHRHELLEGDKHGTDAFRDVIAIAIGFQCMSEDRFRDHHGITAPWTDLDAWIKSEAHLELHDGPVDYIAMIAGAYNDYMPREAEAR